MCANFCTSASDGICDDGGPLAANNWCTLGTDCSDCGVRQYASCSQSCFEHQLGNGVCDEGCNVYECGHDRKDCSKAAIQSTCSERLANKLMPRDPAVPVEVNITVQSLRLVYDQEAGRASAVAKVAQAYAWDDLRLRRPDTNVCLEVVGGMLSATYDQLQVPRIVEEKAQIRSLFDVPEPSYLSRLGPITLMETSYSAAQGLREDNHSHFTAISEVQIFQNHHDYFYFPFDKQTVELPLSTDRVNISMCGHPRMVNNGDRDALSHLFPDTSEWSLDPAVTTLSFIRGGHCIVSIPVKRNPMSFLMTIVAPSLLVVLGSLFSLSVDPEKADAAAARASVLLVAMLLLVENSRDGLTLRAPYLMWADLYLLTQVRAKALSPTSRPLPNISRRQPSEPICSHPVHSFVC